MKSCHNNLTEQKVLITEPYCWRQGFYALRLTASNEIFLLSIETIEATQLNVNSTSSIIMRMHDVLLQTTKTFSKFSRPRLVLLASIKCVLLARRCRHELLMPALYNTLYGKKRLDAASMKTYYRYHVLFWSFPLKPNIRFFEDEVISIQNDTLYL